MAMPADDGIPTVVEGGLRGRKPADRAWPWLALSGGFLLALGLVARRVLR